MDRVTGAATPRLTWYVAAGLIAYGAYAVLSFPANHDTAWFLYIAEVVLDGGQLQHDVVEINPPLIVWFYMLVEQLARLTGIWDFTVHRLVVSTIAFASLLLCARTINRLDWPLAARSAAVILLAYLFIAFTGKDFAQREHLAILLTLPYLLRSAAPPSMRTPTPISQVGIGVLAAAGFALKPFFLLPWLLVELYLVRRDGWRSLLRPAHLAVVAGVAAYAVVVLLVDREYFGYARLFAAAYDAFGRRSLGQMLVLPQAVLALSTIGAVLVLGRARSDDVERVLCVALAGFFLAALIQGKGWDYHWIPASVLAVLLLVLLLLRRVPISAPAAITAAAVAGLLLTAWTVRSGVAYYKELELRPYRLPFLMNLVESEAGGGTIAILSTDMAAAFPLVNHTGVKWGLRFPSLWPIAGFYHPQATEPFDYHQPPAMSDAESYMFDAVLEDLQANRPSLLIIDTAPPFYALHGFSYFEYFGQDPRFAEVMQSYRELRRLELFRVFKRVS